MQKLNTNIAKRAVALYVMAVVVLGNVPLTAFAAGVDLKANGQDTLTLSSPTTPFDITLVQTDAASCSISATGLSSGFTIGSTMTIAPGNAAYPAAGGSNTFTINCLDSGGATQTDSVTVSLAGAPAAAPTVDVKANGSDGPVTLNAGDTYILTWSTANATACQMNPPVMSGVALSGTSVPIGAGSPFYPAAGSTVTITVTCTDGTTNASDSVVIGLGAAPTTSAPTVDVKANGSDGPVTLSAGDTYVLTWNSANATACQMNPPVMSGVSLSGTSTPIASGSPFYPAASSTVTITVTCTNGTSNATDSVVIGLGASPLTVAPTIDVKANGSDGPVTLSSGATYTYTWASTNATACQMTSPVASGTSLSGTSVVIGPGNTFYPTAASSTTITITCTNGTQNATDSVVISLAGTVGGSSPTVDVKANGSDGPITINQGDQYTYTWVSANATACQMTSPVNSGVALSGTSIPIAPGSPFYPALNAPITITITCTNGTSNASDSVVINLAGPNTPPSNTGGGSSNTGGGHSTVLPGNVACPLIHDYMRIDFNNNPLEVMKLQAFLKFFMGYDYVSITGVFDTATFTAVGAFQMQYKDEILTPWGHTGPTHYVYILTLKKINELYCGNGLPLTADEQHEIVAFRNLIQHAQASGATIRYVGSTGTNTNTGGSGSVLETSSGGNTSGTIIPSTGATTTATTTVELPVVGQIDKGQNDNNLAAALFTFPNTVKGTVQFLYELILILVVLYLIGVVLKDVLYSDLPENAMKRFVAKWTTIVIGLVVALVVSYLLGEYFLLLPLLVALVGSLIWLATYSKHSKLRIYTSKKTESIKTTNTVPQSKPV
ncbi:peptidoglycan-binding protein [Candidatus Parcubacteria bacterium]|nr:peptidoglycan-binding protein [Candidatus Parcubacteria bacterium]